MKRTAPILRRSTTSWLLWTNPASLLLVAINDWYAPFPFILLVLLGIFWILWFPLGVYLQWVKVSFKTLSLALLVGLLYSLYLIQTFYNSDGPIRRDFAGIYVGAPVEVALQHMAPYHETSFDGAYKELFIPSVRCDSLRAFYCVLPDDDQACIVALGFKNGKVAYKGMSYEFPNLIFNR